ncbi:MAG: T9SS type A sorting domain-containing protein [Crocinitomicaceae bacterium]|nr:T9SS type A sorting domain-containing protein [Crocinitomicaceae bacterium]
MKTNVMNKKLVLVGSLAVTAIVATVISNYSTPDSAYTPRTQNHSESTPGIDGAFDLYHKLRGDYSREDWLRARNEAEMMPVDRTDFTWTDHGPDNVGGRTRAILVDKNDINHIYAGSVSGGLFESFNRANEWQIIEGFNENLGVSSMCQTPDGNIYIATGHQQEQTGGSQNAYDTGHNGYGIYVKGTDGTINLVSGTTTSGEFDWINEVVCDTVHNIVWIACSGGLKKYDPSSGITDVSGGISSGSCAALSISKDGMVIVANMAGGKTNVSIDGGTSFSDRSGNGAGEIEAGASRVEYAISHEKASNGNYYVYASCANTHLVGIWRSENNGLDWTEIAPAANGAPGNFAPFSHSETSGQGTYDNIISVKKGDPDKIFVGGIDIYSWKLGGNWTQMTQWFYPPQSSQYAHADQHEMVWDNQGRLYIGNDGGLGYSDDGGNTFVPCNRGYNVTQFYAIGFSAHSDVIGGAQDNGTQANYHDNATYKSHDEVGGGDGFSAAISFINRNILFTSVYHGSVSRSSDRGANSNDFTPPQWSCDPGGLESGCGQFFTNFRLWENPMDLNSTDSITYIPQEAYLAGETVLVPSKTSQKFINYVTPSDIVFDDTLDFNSSLTTFDTIITTPGATEYNLAIVDYVLVYDAAAGAPPINDGDSLYIVDLDTTVEVDSWVTINHYFGTNPLRPGKVYDMENDVQVYNVAWDTLKVQDHYQSWFAIGLGGSGEESGVWMTRNSLRLASNSAEWFLVADGIGEVSSMEFSRDGNHLFIGTWTGQIYRLSGFGDVYSPTTLDTLIDWDEGHYATTLTNIGALGAPITSIAVEGDVDHVVVTLGNFSGSGKVRETTNATGGSPTWTSIMGDLPSMPYYSSVIDRDDPNTIVVGGEFGVYYTENGGTTWVNAPGKFGKVPVFDMGQNWRTYDEGSIKPGRIFIGTHGRGIWSTDAYLTLPGEQDNLDPAKYTPNINLYPNPVNDSGNIQFNLETNEDVYVQIFNLNGQLVQEVSQQNMNKGSNIITFDASELPRGTYVVRLTAGSLVETTKFIKH